MINLTGGGWWGWVLALLLPAALGAARQSEALGRGVVAVRQAPDAVFVGWRLLPDDPPGTAFNLYRAAAGEPPVKVNAAPLTAATSFVDTGADPARAVTWTVRAIREGVEGEAGGSFTMPARTPVRGYLSLPVQPRDGYAPNDGSVGDLDGDGELELVLHLAGRGRDNSQSGVTDPPILDAYRLDGRRLWRIHLGRNVREGAHYLQFMVFDLDGDGRAEVACKTADGTIDGTGQVLGDAAADHRNEAGYVLRGPELLTIFEGATGRALATVDYLPPRGDVVAWGDRYGNRVDRFLAAVACLDGERPSLVMARGYYTRAVLVAWDWRDGRLTRRWTFDSDDGTPGHDGYRGQGNHNLSVGDVDGDGRDEIVYGACCIDHDGRGLWTTGLGHGDALHLGDLDPDRPGLEIFSIHEQPRHPHGAELRDARTGQVLWSKPSRDVGRGVAFDIDPRHRGAECWAAGAGLTGLWSTRGETIGEPRPRSCNFGVWWDGDRLRELLDSNRITKWDWTTGTEQTLLVAEGCVANNGTKSTPVLCADILGDWREEVLWRAADNRELRLYTTTIWTPHRLPTLLADPQYRLSVAWQNVGYNQPTQTGFYLGE